MPVLDNYFWLTLKIFTIVVLDKGNQHKRRWMVQGLSVSSRNLHCELVISRAHEF